MTFRARLTLVAAGAVALSIALVALVVFYAQQRELRLLVDDDLRRQATSVAEELLVSGEVGPGVDPSLLVSGSSHVQVVTDEGDVIPLVPDAPRLPVDDRTRAVAAGHHDRFYADAEVADEPVRVLTVPLRNGALQVARSVTELDRHLLHVGGLLVLITVGGITVAVFFGRLVARAALRPIARLTASAERVAATRDLSSRVDTGGRDELGRLAVSLNTMLEALHASQQSQRHLVADASHELRTPLTSLRTNVEVLERAPRLPDVERTRVVSDVRAEIEGLIVTVEDLLDLARDEPSGAEPEDVALDQLVEESVTLARRRAPGIRFETRLRAVTLPVDRSQTQRAIGNLLDNAAKWSPAGGTVEVSLDREGLWVRDHGPGVDPSDLPRVFERFYRAPASRGLPGAGLGLAIVHQVADAHRWQAAAENAEGGGSRFGIRFSPNSSPILSPTSLKSHPALATSGETPGYRETTSRTRRPILAWSSAHSTKLGLVAVAALPLLGALIVSMVLTDDSSPALTTISGELERCGDQFCVGDRVVDFGPAWYLDDARIGHDFDGDGHRALLIEELTGLVGTRVTLETDDGPLDFDVFTVNGLPFRSAQGELPAPDQPTDEVPVAGGGTGPSDSNGGDDRSDGSEASQDGLVTAQGVLKGCGDGLCVEGRELDFGPDWYLDATTADRDLDGDGRAESLAAEIAGLVGTEVELQVLPGERDDRVVTINGLSHRDPRAPPPWSGGP